jgi:hypothetical protein
VTRSAVPTRTEKPWTVARGVGRNHGVVLRRCLGVVDGREVMAGSFEVEAAGCGSRGVEAGDQTWKPRWLRRVFRSMKVVWTMVVM